MAVTLTLPGFAWSAMLKLTTVKLRLITDIEMEQVISSSIRGGIATITHRHAKGNNPYMGTYDPDLEHTYIMYLDCNNLYGSSISQHLPYDDLRFLDDDDSCKINYLQIPDDASTGYILRLI